MAWYWAEGNKELAYASMVAVVPVVGTGASKLAKGVLGAEKAVKATKIISKATGITTIGVELAAPAYGAYKDGKISKNQIGSYIKENPLGVVAGAIGVGLVAKAGVSAFNKYKSDKKVTYAAGELSTVARKVENVKESEKLANAARKTDFYVTPSGDVVPATGYRYMNSKYAKQTMDAMSAPGSYFGFEKFDSAYMAQDAFQVAPKWSDCKLRGEFDTLQVIDNMYIPKAYGGDGPGLEPITRCYPEYGSGGYQQFKYDGLIKFKSIKIIGD